MILPILLTSVSDNNSPLVVKRQKTINDDPREVFDLNTHVFGRRAEGGGAINATETKGELVIKKATYFDPSLKLAVEENGQ